MKTRANEPHKRWNRSLACAAVTLLISVVLPGCIHQPQLLPVSRQKLIDRSVVEYPAGCSLVQIIKGLNCPRAFCWDSDFNLLMSESGIDGSEPHIFGYHKDGSYFNIYPWKRNISFFPTGFVLCGPVDGIAAYQGRIIVSHRDRQGKGVITSLGYDGTHFTIVADLPAQGDYGVTDVAIESGRVYFGVGTASNSGVVGLDNYNEGWLKRHPDVHDNVYSPTNTSIKLTGPRFDAANPWAGLFAGDLAVTGPFQAFGHSNQSRIRPTEKPNGAICSASVDGSDFRVEAYGFHNPRGLAFDEFHRLHLTNDGMQIRGTRPVANDPDSLIKLIQDSWNGWPDYTTDGHPVSDSLYEPPISLLIPSGYRELSQLIDQGASGLRLPIGGVPVYGIFPSLSGASKMVFVPASGPFKDMRGNALVALEGDQSPYVTSGVKLLGRVGFKVAVVDMDNKSVKDFVRNVANIPASEQPFGTLALERPCDVKVGPDGAIYILDFGRMDNNSAIPRYYPGSGALFKLDVVQKPAR